MNKLQNNDARMEEIDPALSAAAQAELAELGIRGQGFRRPKINGIDPVEGRPLIPKRAIKAPEILNEAYAYSLPSSFSRGMRVDLPGAAMLYLSGTASIDDQGRTIHAGDLQAQCMRTFRNLTQLLVAENASWHDVVRTSCYLRDIERDYVVFNEMRTKFFALVGVSPLPASTGIQVRLCRSDLLVEIEAIAIVPTGTD